MRYGTKVSGNLKPLDNVTSLSMSKPGEVYQIDLDVDQIPDEAMVIQQVLTLEQQVPDLKVLWVDTCTKVNKVTVQITDTGPGQWSLTGILSLIPTLFLLAGVIIIGYILWQVWGTQPYLIFGLLLVSGVVLLAYTGVLDKILGTAKPIRPYERGRKAEEATARQIEAQTKILREKLDLAKTKEMRLLKREERLQTEANALQKLVEQGKAKPETLDKKIRELELTHDERMAMALNVAQAEDELES